MQEGYCSPEYLEQVQPMSRQTVIYAGRQNKEGRSYIKYRERDRERERGRGREVGREGDRERKKV